MDGRVYTFVGGVKDRQRAKNKQSYDIYAILQFSTISSIVVLITPFYEKLKQKSLKNDIKLPIIFKKKNAC